MSEASSLRLTHQKTIKKFLNLQHGHKIVVSEKELVSENEGAIQCEKYLFADSNKG